jgi:hypothetical protein
LATEEVRWLDSAFTFNTLQTKRRHAAALQSVLRPQKDADTKNPPRKSGADR